MALVVTFRIGERSEQALAELMRQAALEAMADPDDLAEIRRIRQEMDEFRTW